MHPEDRPRFAGFFLELNTAFDKKVSAIKADMYWTQLKDIPIELIGQATHRWIRDGDRFPRVADLRRMCDLVVASAADRKRIAGPVRYEDFEGEPVYHCLPCEDTGWRWHDQSGSIISSLKACVTNARRVSVCPCRATNPAYRARHPEPEKRYGSADSYRSRYRD